MKFDVEEEGEKDGQGEDQADVDIGSGPADKRCLIPSKVEQDLGTWSVFISV